MDKSTLSNYGWIVIAVLVLAVMIALATPFGSYIKTGVENTTQGLFDTSEKAMNVVGMSAEKNKQNTVTLNCIIGDISADGEINLIDLSIFRRFLAGTYNMDADILKDGKPKDFFINNVPNACSLTKEQLHSINHQIARAVGDCNQDGVTDDQDLSCLRQYNLGNTNIETIKYIGEPIAVTIIY